MMQPAVLRQSRGIVLAALLRQSQAMVQVAVKRRKPRLLGAENATMIKSDHGGTEIKSEKVLQTMQNRKKKNISATLKEEKLKGINDLSVRRKTRRRKNWKRNSRKCRRTQELNKELFRNTPPDSAEETSTRDENDVVEIECGIKGKKGRKIVHKDRASAYRKLKAAEEECEKQRKLVAKYKKRFQSLQNSRRNIGSP